MTELSMREMLEAGVHFGHRKRFWNPLMAPYIFGVRNDIHIINLEKTLPMMQEAVNFIGKIAKKGGKVLFVGTKHSASEVIREEAERCGMPFVDHRWLGGMLTNYKTVRHSIKRLKQLEDQFERNQFGRLTKKEILNLTRERQKLDRGLGGIKNMGGLPDALFIVDIGFEKNAVAEAKKLRIPVIGVVDTNTHPGEIDFMIPGNDDAARSIRYYAANIATTILNAKAGKQSKKKQDSEFVEIVEAEKSETSESK